MTVVVNRSVVLKRRSSAPKAYKDQATENYAARIHDGDCGPGGMQATRTSLLAVRNGPRTEDGEKGLVLLGYRKTLGVAVVGFPTKEEIDREVKSFNGKGLKTPIPNTVDDVPCAQLGTDMPADIQSVSSCQVSSDSWVVAAADALGNAMVMKVDWLEPKGRSVGLVKPRPIELDAREETAHEINSESQVSKRRKQNPISCSQIDVESKSKLNVEGWCGISFPKSDALDMPSHCLITRSLSCMSTLLDLETGKTKSTFYHELPPTALCHIDSNSVVVAEWGSMTLWDTRVGKSVQSESRIAAERLPIYSVDVYGDSFGFIGESRQINLIDLKTWRPRRLWKAPIKHDGIGIKLTSTECFIAGLDHELVCQPLKAPPKERKQQTPGIQEEGYLFPQAVPIGSILHQNHRMLRSEAVWAGFDICRVASAELGTPFVGLANNSVLYSGYYTVC